MSQVERAAVEFVNALGVDARAGIVRGVYAACGKSGLGLMAAHVSRLEGRKVRRSYLAWLGGIREYKRAVRGRRRRIRGRHRRRRAVSAGDVRGLPPVESAWEGSGGKRGRQGGIQNIRRRQFYQSV